MSCKVMFKLLFLGSILAVTISDPHAQGKTNRFVGICIERKGCGLRAEFILRNVIDHQGVEVSITKSVKFKSDLHMKGSVSMYKK